MTHSESPRKGKRKVSIIVYSRTRNCAALVQGILGTYYEVSSFVKPGAQMNVLIKKSERKN